MEELGVTDNETDHCYGLQFIGRKSQYMVVYM
jgi:hypothetical protein